MSQSFTNDAKTEHVVTLSGLAPDTRYYYAVGSSSQILGGGTADSFVWTAPPAGTRKPTRVWILGDSGTADANVRAVRDAYYALTGSTRTDLWLMLGDNAYPDGNDADYQAALFDVFAANDQTAAGLAPAAQEEAAPTETADRDAAREQAFELHSAPPVAEVATPPAPQPASTPAERTDTWRQVASKPAA